MSHRLKLLIGFVAVVLFTVGLFFSLTWFHAKQMVFERIQSTVLSITIAAAERIDGDLHEQIQPGDEESEAYRTIEAVMREDRDHHRREDVYVEYVYTFRPEDPANPAGNWVYVVDAGEPSEDKPRIGDEFVSEAEKGEQTALAEGLKAPYVEDSFLIDEYGRFLSATAPIRDSSGKAVALLGVDLNASDVEGRLQQLLVKGMIGLGVTIVSGIALALVLSTIATRPLRRVKAGVDAIADGDFETRVTGLPKDEFGALGDAVNQMAKSLREREMLKEAFARYVSRDVADRMLESAELPKLEGARQKITVLFSDIRGFTAWSERVQPEEVVAQLNEYFTRMVDIVFSNRGGIDKFIGDGLMAVFGAPLEDEDQEHHAVKTMLEMHEVACELAANWKIKGQHVFQIGMAVHTGAAVVGNIGSEQKMDYTAVGRTVNVAARLEAHTKKAGVAGLISAETAQAVRDRFEFESLGNVQLPGVSGELEVFTLPELRR